MQDFTVDFYFRQYWHDPRLNFSGSSDEDELCISNEMLKLIWWPDTFFANAKMASFHLATTHNAFVRINPNGFISQSLRYCAVVFPNSVTDKSAVEKRPLSVEETPQNCFYLILLLLLIRRDNVMRHRSVCRGRTTSPSCNCNCNCMPPCVKAHLQKADLDLLFIYLVI